MSSKEGIGQADFEELMNKRSPSMLDKLHEQKGPIDKPELSIEELEDIRDVLLTQTRWEDDEKRLIHVVNCINISRLKLIEKIETIINAQ